MLRRNAIEPPPSCRCGVSVLPPRHVRCDACHKPGGGLFFDVARSPNLFSGSYLMKGANVCILYAGKAGSLCKRSSSCFRGSKTRHCKTEMIARIRGIEVILARNEREV